MTQTKLCTPEYFDAARETVRDYEAKGAFTREPDGTYDAMKCMRSVIKWQAQRLAGRAPSMAGEMGLSQAKAALAVSQTKSVELKNKIASREYISTLVILKAIRQAFSLVRERLLTLPGKLGDPDGRWRQEIMEILNELKDPQSAGDLGEDVIDDVSSASEEETGA